MKRLIVFCFVISCLFSGCKTFMPDSYIKANMRKEYSKKIDSLFVLINKDGIPEEFLDFYTKEFESYFSAKNVKIKIMPYEELNIERPFMKSDLVGYNFLLQIDCIRSFYQDRRTNITGLDLTALLKEISSDQIVMRSNIHVGKGYGYGFGESEAIKSFSDLAKKSFEKLNYN